jgi:asparagine synthase (glutamine-hydrolysing)
MPRASSAGSSAGRCPPAGRCSPASAAWRLASAPRCRGGLDSGTVAALAARRLGPGAVVAYSASFPGHPEIDEGQLVDALAADLGIASVRVEIEGGSVLRGALAYVDEWQAPLISPNHALWPPLRERAAADGIEVLLDGEGGDELVAAQPYLIADRVAHGRVPSALALGRALAGDRPDRDRLARRALVRFGARGALPATLHERVRQLRGSARYAPPWLRPDAARVLLATERPWDWKRRGEPRWRAALHHSLIEGRDALGVHEYLRRASAGGPPAAHPLLDQELADLAFGLDPALAYDGPLDRPVLRAAVAGPLPEAVRLRPHKSYFDSFHAHTLRTADRPALERLLSDPAAEVYAFADRAAVAPHLLRPLADPAAPARPGWSASLWRLAAVECWLRAQADPAFPREALERWDLPPLRAARRADRLTVARWLVGDAVRRHGSLAPPDDEIGRLRRDGPRPR